MQHLPFGNTPGARLGGGTNVGLYGNRLHFRYYVGGWKDGTNKTQKVY